MVLAASRNRELVAVVAYMAACSKEQLRGLRVEVDGAAVSFDVRKDLNPRCIVARLPERTSRSDALTELALVLPYTVAPSSMNRDDSDERRLGLAVYSVSVLPARPSLARRPRISRLERLVRWKRKGPLAEDFPASCFDGLAYLEANPDVAEAVACGKVASALDHYCHDGYRERRAFALAITRDANAGYALDIARTEAMHDAQGRIVALRSELRADANTRLAALRSEITGTNAGIAALRVEIAVDANARAAALRSEMRADAEARAAQAGKQAAAYTDASLAAWTRADEARRHDLGFQLDALRGGAAEIQKELGTTQEEIYRLKQEASVLTTRFTGEVAALATRVDASIGKIQANLPGFALAPELEATRVEVGKAVSGLEALRAELRRLDEFAREGMERLYAQNSVVEAVGMARERDLSGRLAELDESSREALERIRSDVSSLAATGESRERDLSARLERLDESSRAALERIHSDVSALAATRETREQELSSRLELVRAQAGDVTTTLAAAVAALDAVRSDVRALEQSSAERTARLQAEMSALAAAGEAREKEHSSRLDAVRVQAADSGKELSARLDAVHAQAADIASGLTAAARAEDLTRLAHQTQLRLEELRREAAAETAREKARHDELESGLEQLRKELVGGFATQLEQLASKAARTEDVERLKREALHDLERLRGEMTAAAAMREVRDQGTLQQIEWLRANLQEAQGKLAAAARVEDVERLRRDAGHDFERVRSEIGSIGALQKARESAFAAQIDTVKAEVDAAKSRAELAEAKVGSVQRELGAETWQIAGTVSALGNKVESAGAEVTKIQQELGAVKNNAARIVHPHLNMLNVLGYQAHSRRLARADAEKLAKHWAPLLGLKVEEKELFYLAHRIGNIESACSGRLAAAVNDILLRILVARAVKARRMDILEIGTLFGLGISALHEALAPLYEQVRFTVIDPLEGFYGAENKDILTGVPVNRTVFEENLRRTGVQSDNVTLVQRLSTDPQALTQARKKRYDVLIIDGDHSYAGVKNDTEKFVATAKPGAYIIFDDYGNQHWPDVKKYVDGEVLPRKDLKFLGAEWHTAVCQVGAA